MIERTALAAHPTVVAPLLLGGLLRSRIGDTEVTVRLTEVEAYGGVGEDPGSHAHRRLTPRNASMFGEAGHAYVYFTYGMHWCLNVVAHGDQAAGAVLLRGGEVVAGQEIAARRRGTTRSRDLARGPARLAVALGVDATVDGTDLVDPRGLLELVALGDATGVVRAGPRTGVAGAGAPIPWRFWLDGDPTVSPHRPAVPRPRR